MLLLKICNKGGNKSVMEWFFAKTSFEGSYIDDRSVLLSVKMVCCDALKRVQIYSSKQLILLC